MKIQKVTLTLKTTDGGDITIETKDNDKRNWMLVIKTPEGTYENHPVYGPKPMQGTAFLIKRIGLHISKGNSIVNILPYKLPEKKK